MSLRYAISLAFSRRRHSNEAKVRVEGLRRDRLTGGLKRLGTPPSPLMLGADSESDFTLLDWRLLFSFCDENAARIGSIWIGETVVVFKMSRFVEEMFESAPFGYAFSRVFIVNPIGHIALRTLVEHNG